MSNIADHVSKLNPEQKQAVFHGNGPCVVNAVPGSGKTRCLTTRYAKLLNDGVRGDQILCCTFTRKASIEMKERITEMLGNSMYRLPHIGTMHSIFFRMLKDHPDFVGMAEIGVLSRNFSIYKYFKETAKKFGDDPKNVDCGELQRKISSAKNEMLSPDELQQSIFKATGEVMDPVGPVCANSWDYYKDYERQKREDRMVDYDDMLTMTHDMLVNSPNILQKWQATFQYVMIDEFQDINKIQWAIIKTLVASHKNLFVVGDANQSIYKFRGAHPEFIFKFDKEFPGAKVINMTLNYRSGDDIIKAANRLIKNAVNPSPEIRGTGKPSEINTARFDSSSAEGRTVASEIEILIKDGASPKDIGVIYRVNRCAAGVEVALARAKIPYRSKQGDGFFGSALVKDILAYLMSAVAESDVKSVSRIINKPNRYLGAAFKAAWEDELDQGHKPKEALALPYSYGPPYWSRNASVLAMHLTALKSMVGSASQAIEYVCKDIGYEDWAAGEGEMVDIAKRDMLEELWQIAEEDKMSVSDLLATANQAVSFDRKGDAVSLMTVHGSKGLEFDHVFFVGLAERVLPHSHAGEGAEEIDEERRMFYVGTTRAIKKLNLFISKPKNRKDDESGAEAGGSFKTSRFVEEAGFNG